MTTVLPAPNAPRDPLPAVRRLHLPGAPAREAPPLDGYLVLVPAGTDPADLFAAGTVRPEIRPVVPAQHRADDSVRVDPAARVAVADGIELALTFLEFELLAHLVAHPRQVYSREQLLARIWGYDHAGDGRTVDVHVARLRRKLGPAHRHRIVTVRRAGYKYVPDPGPAPDSGPYVRG